MFAKEKKKEKKSESLSGVVRLSVSDSVRPWQSFCDRVTIVPRRPGTESKTRWKPIDPPFEPQERRGPQADLWTREDSSRRGRDLTDQAQRDDPMELSIDGGKARVEQVHGQHHLAQP
jgi:hypothetical protein